MRGRRSVKTLALLAFLAFGTVASNSWAGLGPENIFLIVNPRGPASMEVANHYIALRKIPPANVCYIPGPPNANRMAGADFRELVLRPALAEIKKRGLEAQIDAIVYSCQYPWQIDFAAMFSGVTFPQQHRPMASLTGATYLYEFVESSSAKLVEWETNHYAGPQGGPSNTRAFHAGIQWGPSGARVDSGGRRYLLSMQLGCSRPEGNTAEEIVTYLKRAAVADGARPAGTFYYMVNSDVRTTVRVDGFASAISELRALGLQAETASGVVPPAGRTIAGLTTGSPQVPLGASGSKLAPGALVDNLTSTGAFFQPVPNPRPQTRISEYLRLGAAGASGTVIEPFAIPPKFPSPALHVHYARGASTAEAFYLSVQGPYQLLLLGDPLCQPWARIPEVAVEGLAQGAMLTGTIELTPSAMPAAGAAIKQFELFVDGVRTDDCKTGEKLALDTTQLDDGYHELRVVAIDDSNIETQGRWIGEVNVANGSNVVSLAGTGPTRPGGPAALTVTSAVEGTVAILHNGREVGRLRSPQRTVQIPSAKLGTGPVTLQARTIGAKPVRSRPLQIDIP
jgi:hypothetical protein